jgi:hypothetical protein
MITVSFKDKYNCGEIVRDTRSGIKTRVGSISQVTYLEADGEDLTYIKEYISGLPINLALTSNRWFGDDAKFILANIE